MANMIKLYLTGPNVGKSRVINGTVFQNGVANVNADHKGIIKYLVRYHAVSNKDPVAKSKEAE